MQISADSHITQNLESFSHWAKEYCKGSERGNAQLFLNEFFKIFGYAGALEAGASFEDPLKKSSAKGKTGFIDCLFKDIALIEMKKRGTNLSHHYNQLLNYWVQCVPKPKYAVLCNFEQFWIYDFNIQVDTPVQELTITDWHLHPEALAFMQGKKPDFGLNTVQVTEQAAEDVSTIYNSLIARKNQFGFTEEDARRFILQCVLCMFAEDIGLMPWGFFTKLMDECRKDPTQSYDILRALFIQMNTKQPAMGGRFKEIKYFNGGLFAQITPIEMTAEECELMYRIAKEDWRGVRPSIFGTILETTMDNKERHASGVHFTSDLDIYKIVNPTIVRYWEERIEKAGENISQLRSLLKELRAYKVLDPACGSGNFLYIAYLEMKRLEKQLMDRIQEVVATSKKKFTAKDAEGTDISLVSPMQFYGIDIKPFGVELAKLTLEIGRKIAVDRFNLHEDPLPLDNLDKNILCEDALFNPWPEADAIIGNPPFLGKSRVRLELGDEYVNNVWMQFPDMPRNVDFCTYWFKKAHLQKAERCGLVATNSISQGFSREASLTFIINNSGYIHDAISTQIWSGEAKVHVSIVNWARDDQKQKFLDNKPVNFINSSLKNEVDVTNAHRLKLNLQKCFTGVQPNGKGFIISLEQASEWIKADLKNERVLKIFSMGKNLADSSNLLSERWIIDFADMSVEEASVYKLPFEHVKNFVKPERELNRELILREKWWRFKRTNIDMRTALENICYCFATPLVSKWNIFVVFHHKKVLAGNKTVVVANEDFYILGLLTSRFHRDWVESQKATLKGDISYTNTTCFETFPFLWEVPEKKKEPVRALMKTLDDYRMTTMKERGWGITQLYNAFFNEPASQLYKLHRQLDEAVCAVYGWKYDPDKNYNEKLYELNLEIYEAETQPLLKDASKLGKKRKS